MVKELEFSVDYDGECEDYTYTIDGVQIDTIEFEEVTDFIKKLEESVEKFWLLFFWLEPKEPKVQDLGTRLKYYPFF